MYGCRDSVTKRPHKFVQQFSFRHSIQFHLTIFSVLVVITYFFFVSLSDFFPPPLIFTLFFFLFSILSVRKTIKTHQLTCFPPYSFFDLDINSIHGKVKTVQRMQGAWLARSLSSFTFNIVFVDVFFEDLIFFGIISKLWKLCFFFGSCIEFDVRSK